MARAAGTAGPTAGVDDGPKHGRARYPMCLTLDLSQEDHDALIGALYADRVWMAHRIRALVSLWLEDPALAEAVSIRAQELM